LKKVFCFEKGKRIQIATNLIAALQPIFDIKEWLLKNKTNIEVKIETKKYLVYPNDFI